ncbi:MAG: transcription-repair coupling factor [Anaerohalosphaeraceae bacterium]
MNLTQDKTICDLVSRLEQTAKGVVKADGTWGSFAPLLATHIAKTLTRPLLYISPHIDDADRVCDDLQTFGGTPAQTFPVWESPPGNEDNLTDEIGSQRLRLVLELSQPVGGPRSGMISTSVQALNQPIPKVDTLRRRGLELAAGKTLDPQDIITWLVEAGFERTDSVDYPGQFAHRGGILDIFAPVSLASAGSSVSEPQAVRVEFFGDQIESIRLIDLDTQRSGEALKQITLVAAVGQTLSMAQATELFLNVLPPETIVVLEEPIQIAEVSEVFLGRLDDPRGMFSWEAIYKALRRFTCLEISRFAADSDSIHLDVTSAQEFEHKAGSLWKEGRNALTDLIERAVDCRVILYCENQAEMTRVKEILQQTAGGIPPHLKLRTGFVSQGFILRGLRTIVISHHELFGQASVRRRIRTLRSVSPIDSMMDLHKGDYVVHVAYGIGRFLGIEMMEKAGRTGEYLTIEYADKVRIHVPASNIHLVHKFIGSMPRRPMLSRIGTKKWEKQKQQVAVGVEELAAELLEVQAQRQKLGGFAFGADTLWQKEFEESFPYQETPDQLTSADQIKRDMAEAIPMDRLLCGDVGYGKTELAMRAAFKAVQAGKQVAVLAPTTVLCVQHGRTFAERFAEFPITIEVLNRFTPPKQVRDILYAARQGKVDILVGTHRLLSDDVGFKDLGLLVIDEEQRFGVEHKERLKRFRVNVDVLTMSATPIPRTLHMAMIGLRDISSLATPPLDRRSVATRVCRFDRDTIRKAIRFELGREGQVFYLHNRVQTINGAAQIVRDIIADDSVKVDVAHGQMHKHELEDAMVRFVKGQTQVLVCSTIIEAGLDIPNANTMIIVDADRFGLSQLHQLRGRVGRYKHRAYAYLLLPPSRPVNPIAAKRLKAIEEFSQLGSGFRIALRDLEIRGAGNILGPEQSGHINTVGYELYCQLLGEAVAKLRNEPVEQPAMTAIDLGFHVGIPKNYIASDRQRLEVYRRAGQMRTAADIRHFEEELRDLFGPLPDSVRTLLDIAELRMYAARWKIRSLIVQGMDLIFSFEEGAYTADLFARSPGRVSIPDPRTVYVRLDKTYFEPHTLTSVLRKLLKRTR